MVGGGTFRDAVPILLAGRKVRPEYESATPDVSESERGQEFHILTFTCRDETEFLSTQGPNALDGYA